MGAHPSIVLSAARRLSMARCRRQGPSVRPSICLYNIFMSTRGPFFVRRYLDYNGMVGLACVLYSVRSCVVLCCSLGSGISWTPCFCLLVEFVEATFQWVAWVSSLCVEFRCQVR